MKTVSVLFAGAMLCALGSSAFADDLPQLTGTWKGKSDGISMKGGYLDGADVAIVITEQKGRSFKGEITYPVQGKPVTDALVGTVDPDGDHLYMVAGDGIHIVEYDDGVLESCYVSDEDGMAVCMELTKQ